MLRINEVKPGMNVRVHAVQRGHTVMIDGEVHEWDGDLAVGNTVVVWDWAGETPALGSAMQIEEASAVEADKPVNFAKTKTKVGPINIYVALAS